MSCTRKEKYDFMAFVTYERKNMMEMVACQTGDEGCECDTDNSCSTVTFLLMTTRPL